MDSSDHPHIAFSHFVDSNMHTGLSYAWYDGANWHNETIEFVSLSEVSLALDSEDNPHISYFLGWSELAYTKRFQNVWHKETFEVSEGRYADLALDHPDNPYVSYLDESQTVLKFASTVASPTINASLIFLPLVLKM